MKYFKKVFEKIIEMELSMPVSILIGIPIFILLIIWGLLCKSVEVYISLRILDYFNFLNFLK